MHATEAFIRMMVRVVDWQRAGLAGRGDDPERGDVPGWVFVTMMSAALVGALYLVAGAELERVLREALASVIP